MNSVRNRAEWRVPRTGAVQLSGWNSAATLALCLPPPRPQMRRRRNTDLRSCRGGSTREAMKRIAQLARDTRQQDKQKITDAPSSRERASALPNARRLFGLAPSRWAAHWLPLIAGLCLAAVAAATIGLGLQYRSQLDWVRHTEEVKGNLTEAFSLVQDAELGKRGYLLTGDEAYARRIDDARIAFDHYVTGLEALMADNAEQQAALVKFRDLGHSTFRNQQHRRHDPSP